MFKYGLGYVNAGENDIHRYGRKAQELIKAYLEPNNAGFYSIPVDGDKYYTIGTSKGKYGEFCKMNGTIFSVNSMGNAYAKAGTEKGEKFVEVLKAMIEKMQQINAERIENLREEEEEMV